ncbi:response regulator [Flavobacterium rakeshii]|uniref:Response regulator n=1 Tax=Flavobacterium rakeshii TaxID=1038845 RepID=A0A6N8HHA9_9FLAO|nr:response regulator [Flavobacterium rakeshii]MEE1899342.1 response regulator [Flavobacterium rakeshii]MUV05046.1 response regulator [Flavobacterium rakeshii]
MNNELTIFYTDDDQEDIDFFREIIDIIDTNVKVVTQRNGEELLHALDNPPPTPYLVFLDINMPGMNGLETLRRMRESEKHKDLPVVMFSTSSDDITIQQSKDLGASFYVPKSGAFDKLKKSIEHTLKINWDKFTVETNDFVYFT